MENAIVLNYRHELTTTLSCFDWILNLFFFFSVFGRVRSHRVCRVQQTEARGHVSVRCRTIPGTRSRNGLWRVLVTFATVFARTVSALPAMPPPRCG